MVNIVNNSSSQEVVPYFFVNIQQKINDLVQNALANSLWAQFQDYSYFRQYGMGDVVVLVGPSNSGKTSIVKALKKIEPDRREDGSDLRCFAISLNVLTKYNPKEIEILRKALRTTLDIPKAVHRFERAWKMGVSSQEKIAAEEAIRIIKETENSLSAKEQGEIYSFFQNREIEMFDEVFELSRRGANVICDVMNINILAKHILMRNFTGPIRVVLIYCPFHTLSVRMEKRNREALKSGELSNQRIGEFPLMQFSEIYTHQEKGQSCCERLTRERVTKTFNENYERGVEYKREVAHIEGRNLPSEKEFSEEKEELLAELLKNLGFIDRVDFVEVAPKSQGSYHLFLNTSILSPKKSAKIIHKGTYLRYQTFS